MGDSRQLGTVREIMRLRALTRIWCPDRRAFTTCTRSSLPTPWTWTLRSHVALDGAARVFTAHFACLGPLPSQNREEGPRRSLARLLSPARGELTAAPASAEGLHIEPSTAQVFITSTVPGRSGHRQRWKLPETFNEERALSRDVMSPSSTPRIGSDQGDGTVRFKGPKPILTCATAL
ncbi:hypothetical protein BV20DRAFT_963484 [Pilatotrama ljubarskyi]|nr:hypothetical protein BV20DRAFT_963484 [Pilatotrama ljubarskyi]